MLSQQLRDARDLVVPPWAVPPYASKQNGGYNASISVQTRGGGTAASVAVPRRSARIAGTAGGNQAVSTHEDDGASSRSLCHESPHTIVFISVLLSLQHCHMSPRPASIIVGSQLLEA